MPDAPLGPPRPSISPALVAATLVALVLFRAVVWVGWEQSHFDPDQAVIGLMGQHIAEGRAFPVFMYGQTYLLTIESWLAAPLFAAFGASVPLLKAPILAMDVAIVLLLYFGLLRAGTTAIGAWLASLFFAMAPPITGSRLVEAAGGHIEPFLFALLLWWLRHRAVWYGIVAGIGVTHREFAWYAVAATLALDVWGSTAWSRRRLRHWATVAIVLVLVGVGLRALARRDPVLGPGTEGMAVAGLMTTPAGRLCIDPSTSLSNLHWLFTRNLPALFGWRPEPLRYYNLNSDLTAGHWWVLAAIVAIAGMAVVRVVPVLVAWRPSWSAGGPEGRRPEIAPSLFPGFLVLVGVQAALVYALASCGVQRQMYIRYDLLTLFVASGATAWLLTTLRQAVGRRVVIAAVLAWTFAAAWDTARVLHEYLVRTPPNPVRELITHLERRGLRLGHAPYEIAYMVTFMSREQVVLGSTDIVRINEYQDRVHSSKTPVVYVRRAPCELTAPAATELDGWCIEWD
ncbi:MAG: hypothetical protein IT184_16060 [Acidobacteria bacterium]|nr:hypothetical protein [Acidobacteriota bacterium]